MSSANVSTNFFFVELQQQNGGQHSVALILTAVLLNCVGIPGFLMNLSVLYVTIRNRSVHESANFLLALSSLFEMGHEAGHLLFLWLALSGHNFMPYALCVRAMALPLFCIGGIFGSMLCTGVDRMICVLTPNFHAHLNQFIYLAAHCTFCLALCTYILVSFLHCSVIYPSYPVTGYVSDLIIGECQPVYTYSSLVTNLATIIVYLLVGGIIWLRSTFSQLRLFHSLVVIILANIGGYFYVSLMRAFVVPNLNLSFQNMWYLLSYNGILLNVSSACNAPVLYFLSKDYRTAYRKEFGGALCRMLRLVGHHPGQSSVGAAAVAGTMTRTVAAPVKRTSQPIGRANAATVS